MDVTAAGSYFSLINPVQTVNQPLPLLGVPKPFPFEAVSAWISRLAFSQCETPGSIADFLGLAPRLDIDRAMYGNKLAAMRGRAGLQPEDFAIADQITGSLASIAPIDDQYLIRARSNRAGFRFCIRCLESMRTPHFQIHWRFIAWRRCPLHECLLEDCCPHCKAPVLFPYDVETSTGGRIGYATLALCGSCGGKLTDEVPVSMPCHGVAAVKPREELMMSNGRALVAALFHGYLQMGRGRTEYGLGAIEEIHRRGDIPTELEWMSPDKFRAPVCDGRA